MRSKLLISVSAIALIAGAGFAAAQEKGGAGGGPSQAPQSTSPAEQSAPSAPKGGADSKGQAQQRQGDQPQRAQDQRNQPEQKGAQDQRDQKRDNRAQEKSSPDAKGSAADSKSDKKGDNRAQEKSSPDAKGSAADSKSDKKGDTTGQGAAGSRASLTTEQRTKIKTTIKQSNVRPVTNVNFNISVGTVIPRSVTLHALPAAVIEIYPEWRPYRFILVGDDILVIEPDTFRIVAVLDA